MANSGEPLGQSLLTEDLRPRTGAIHGGCELVHALAERQQPERLEEGLRCLVAERVPAGQASHRHLDVEGVVVAEAEDARGPLRARSIVADRRLLDADDITTAARQLAGGRQPDEPRSDDDELVPIGHCRDTRGSLPAANAPAPEQGSTRVPAAAAGWTALYTGFMVRCVRRFFCPPALFGPAGGRTADTIG